MFREIGKDFRLWKFVLLARPVKLVEYCCNVCGMLVVHMVEGCLSMTLNQNWFYILPISYYCLRIYYFVTNVVYIDF